MPDVWSRLDYRETFIPEIINIPCFAAVAPEIKCQACVEACPHQALHRRWGTIEVDSTHCDYCGRCYRACPADLVGVKGLDPLLVRLKHDREQGATVLTLFCDRQRYRDVLGGIKIPTLWYISPEMLFWSAALGYEKIVMPDGEYCRNCRHECPSALVSAVDRANSWLNGWDRCLEILVLPAEQEPAEKRTLSRREFFTGFKRTLTREVTGLVVEEVRNRLAAVLPKTQQGFMRRQPLKAMALKLLSPPGNGGAGFMMPQVDPACSGCRVCSTQCSMRALVYGEAGITIKPWLCNECGFCTRVCSSGLINMQPIEDWKEYFRLHHHQFARASGEESV